MGAVEVSAKLGEPCVESVQRVALFKPVVRLQLFLRFDSLERSLTRSRDGDLRTLTHGRHSIFLKFQNLLYQFISCSFRITEPCLKGFIGAFTQRNVIVNSYLVSL